jgi:hypothetical protein
MNQNEKDRRCERERKKISGQEATGEGKDEWLEKDC